MKPFQFLCLLLAGMAGAYAEEAGGGKAAEVYIVCQDYQRLGGCSRTSEQVRWLAWLRLNIQASGQVVMRLRARGEENLVSWENARDSSTITQWIELSWPGRAEEKNGRVKIELEPPQGHVWERLRSSSRHFLPQDRRPRAGLILDCVRMGGDRRGLTCPVPDQDKQPVDHLARLAYFLVQHDRIDLPAAPGELWRRSDDSLQIEGEPGGAGRGEAGKQRRSLTEALDTARVALAGGDEAGALAAAQLLAVCDPDAKLPPAAFQWLLAPADGNDAPETPEKVVR